MTRMSLYCEINIVLSLRATVTWKSSAVGLNTCETRRRVRSHCWIWSPRVHSGPPDRCSLGLLFTVVLGHTSRDKPVSPGHHGNPVLRWWGFLGPPISEEHQQREAHVWSMTAQRLDGPGLDSPSLPHPQPCHGGVGRDKGPGAGS